MFELQIRSRQNCSLSETVRIAETSEYPTELRSFFGCHGLKLSSQIL